jgi:LemA protein
MKKSIIAAIVVVVFGAIVLFQYSSIYNEAVNNQETVDQSWNDVSAAYQRRADLVPQLFETVKGAAKNEKEILTAVTQARAGIVNAQTPKDMQMFGKKINTAINLAFEAYPQIRSTDRFADLQAQLEGTENRINKARTDYNATIKIYNTHIRGFFTKMILNDEEFPKKEGFQASQGAEKAPEIKF